MSDEPLRVIPALSMSPIFAPTKVFSPRKTPKKKKPPKRGTYVKFKFAVHHKRSNP